MLDNINNNISSNEKVETINLLSLFAINALKSQWNKFTDLHDNIFWQYFLKT